MKEAYGKIMDFAWMQTATGTYDFQTAVREATKKLLERGLRVIPGKDGRSYCLEYAVRSYITNRMGEMFNAVNRMNYDATGADGWEISAHPARLPTTRLTRAANIRKRNTTASTTAWPESSAGGTAVILCIPSGWASARAHTAMSSCRSIWMTMKRGVWYNGQHYTLSEARDRKRQLESLISQTKYDILAAEGDDQLLKERQIRLQNQRREYERFCRETGQEPENWRTMVATFGRSEGQQGRMGGQKAGTARPCIR